MTEQAWHIKSWKFTSTTRHQLVHIRQGLVHHHADHAQRVVCGHEVIEVAHGEQALGEGVGSAHGWLVCLLDWVASIVLAGHQLRSDGGKNFSSLLSCCVGVGASALAKGAASLSGGARAPQLVSACAPVYCINARCGLLHI